MEISGSISHNFIKRFYDVISDVLKSLLLLNIFNL